MERETENKQTNDLSSNSLKYEVTVTTISNSQDLYVGNFIVQISGAKKETKEFF